MPEIVDTDAKMQESVPEFLDAVFQASKERLAKRKLAVQQAQAKEAQIAQAEQKPREVAGARRRRRTRSTCRGCIAALPDGEREKEMEAAEIVAGQGTSRRSVSTHMSGQQGTSSAFMMRPETGYPSG
jgi:hypothetical protein